MFERSNSGLGVRVLVAATVLGGLGALASCARGGGAPATDPSVTDACGDGLDGDSDGRVDEGCACEVGATQACYTANAEALDHNPCRRGTQQCVGQGGTAAWGACGGAVVPGTEKCDGIDNDCNGAVDDLEQCPCDPSKPPRACYTGPSGTEGKGACSSGTQRCRTDGSGWDACEGDTTPHDEVCGNSIDEDCDGALNNSADADGDFVNVCAGDCDDQDPERKPGLADLCDGKDNDCDSKTDEAATPQATSCGLGVCVNTGSLVCQGGMWVTQCTPKPATGNDNNCDTIDDDCDGAPDNHFVQAAPGCGVGACARAGQAVCTNGTVTNTCTPGAPTGTDNDCDAVDDDCDGMNDDAYVAQTLPCGVGVCASTGPKSCVNGQEVHQCTPGSPTGPDASCDGINQDCDANTDEAYVVTACDNPSDTDACTDDQKRCISGAVTCVDVGGSIAELCNGADDNCNGQFDEAGCPAGCSVSSYGGHRYMYCNVTKSWLEARSVCTTYGYDLAKIESNAENDTVYSALGGINASDKWWLGLNDRASEAGSNVAGFRWTDGTAPSFSVWYSGEPNNFGNGAEGEDCVLINYMGSSGWNDAICGEPHRFVCEHN